MPTHQRIRTRREELNLSLEQLAERLRPYWPRIDPSALSKIERGRRTLAADKLPMFAKVLECRPEELLDPL